MKSKLTIIILIVVIAAIFVVVYANYRAGLIIYNNGTCTECGGHYHIVGTPTKNYHYYTYECDRCGDGFITVTMMHKDN